VQREIESGERRVVGVNCNVEGEPALPHFTLDPAIERMQRERLAAFRRARSAAAVERALDEVKRTAEGSANLMPDLIAALRARATIGEVLNAARRLRRFEGAVL
jgi:methylmalonyl-CoA mutase N-terminal domain/subunit